MVRHRWWYVLWCLLLSVVALGIGQSVGRAQPLSELPSVVATVNGQPITAAELRTAARGELFRLEMQRYRILRDSLEKLVADRLLQLEAAKRGVTVRQLEAQEIAAKVAPVTDEQVKAFYQANQSRIRHPFDQIASRIRAYLQQQAQEKRRRAFLHTLRQRYTVTVALSPPTVAVSADDDPSLGPADAPVTIIEFSDFQCPFCRRAQPTLKRLLREYKGMIRLVYRDFPLRRIHPQAQKAAEAAQCAAEQQRFWPYHDTLFAATSLQVADLKRYAQELGLNMTQFNTCLDSGKYAAEVQRDLQDGLQAGVNATPSFFINGRPLTGAVPYERFKELIDGVLEQTRQVRTSP